MVTMLDHCRRQIRIEIFDTIDFMLEIIKFIRRIPTFRPGLFILLTMVVITSGVEAQCALTLMKSLSPI